MLIPGVPIHYGTNFSDEHDRLLYNTIRFRIQEIIREYLPRMQRAYPIYLVFDMSDMILNL